MKINSIITLKGIKHKYQVIGLNTATVLLRLVEGFEIKHDEPTRIKKPLSEIDAVVVEDSFSYQEEDCYLDYDLSSMGAEETLSI